MISQACLDLLVHGIIRGKSQTDLITLAPPSVLSLVSDQEVTRLARIVRGLIGLANKGETLEGKLCGIREANTP